jgi:sulfatase maturation enzyme AslB (radical SAM superfamily)
MSTDSIGVVLTAENDSPAVHTRHINKRWVLICENIEAGLMKIVPVRKRGNDTEILTKNVNNWIYERYMLNFSVNWRKSEIIRDSMGISILNLQLRIKTTVGEVWTRVKAKVTDKWWSHFSID